MKHSFRFLIDEPAAGLRVDEFFASRFGSLSRMRIANLIESGACLVNDACARAGYRLAPGDAVEFSFEDGAPTSMTPEPIPLEILHEDDHLLVIVKPAGMLVHPTMNVKSGTLANALSYHLNKTRVEDRGSGMEDRGSRMEDRESPKPVVSILDSRSSILDSRSSILDLRSSVRPGIVHRLDRATSGIMLIAKTPRALAVLSRHFRKRLIAKSYLALVHGVVEAELGSISASIGRDPNRRPQWQVDGAGKPAETRLKIVERLRDATLLELEPVTGRTNQLRIHCAHIGHPIVGDDLYCGLRNSDCGLSNHENQGGCEQSAIGNPQSAIRLCLHAWKLAFHHPAGGEWLEFRSAMPGAMESIVDRYR